MKDAGREDRVRTGGDNRREMLGRPRSPACDERHADDSAYGARQLEVEAGLRAVGVHRVEQDLPHTELLTFARPFDGVNACAPATAVGRHLEAGRRTGRATRIDGQDEHLAAETLADVLEQLG